jgi:hypothetical protein
MASDGNDGDANDDIAVGAIMTIDCCCWPKKKMASDGNDGNDCNENEDNTVGAIATIKDGSNIVLLFLAKGVEKGGRWQ